MKNIYLILCVLLVTASCARDKSLSLYVPGGLNGTNGLNAIAQGLSCAVHDLPSWNGSTSLPAALVGNPIIGTFNLPNFSVGDSPSANGFPGMPADLQNAVGLEGYALDCNGLLLTDTSGQYIFKLFSDDGSELRINDQLVVNNQGLHAPQEVSSPSTRLNRGLNRINVVYYQGPHSQVALRLKMSGPNQPEQVIPSSQFFTEGAL